MSLTARRIVVGALAAAFGCTSSSAGVQGPVIDQEEAGALLPLDPEPDGGCWGPGPTAARMLPVPHGDFGASGGGGAGAWIAGGIDVQLPDGAPATLANVVPLFGGVPGRVGTFDDAKKTLSVIVPEGARSGPLSLAYGCLVTRVVDTFVVDEVPAAHVTAMTPSDVAVGATATITGAFFTTARVVTFGGVQEPFSVLDDGTLFVEVDTAPAARRVGILTASGQSYFDP